MESQLPRVQTKANFELRISNSGSHALIFVPRFAIRNSRFEIPVQVVADDRMSDVCAVYSQLVRASSYRFKLKKSRSLHSFENLESCLRGLSGFQYSPLRLPRWISSDGRDDRAGLRFNPPVNASHVSLRHQPPPEVVRQYRERARRLGYHHQPGSRAIKPVHNSGPRDGMRIEDGRSRMEDRRWKIEDGRSRIGKSEAKRS